jgi:hypothetical protein
LVQHSERLPDKGGFFVRQSHEFIGLRGSRRVVSAGHIYECCEKQRGHQSGSLTDFARIVERVI